MLDEVTDVPSLNSDSKPPLRAPCEATRVADVPLNVATVDCDFRVVAFIITMNIRLSRVFVDVILIIASPI
jgi:hypothetical protein